MNRAVNETRITELDDYNFVPSYKQIHVVVEVLYTDSLDV